MFGKVRRTPGELAELLHVLRRRTGLTQEEVAARAGMSLGGLRDLEQQRVTRPRTGTLRRLAAALELSAAETAELIRLGQQGPLLANDLRLQVLGPLTALVKGNPVGLSSERQRTLLGVLALSPGEPVSLDTLVDAMWGAQPPPTAAVLVQTQVSRLRRRLQPTVDGERTNPILVTAGAGYALRVDTNQLDLLAFRHLVEEARRHAKNGQTESALRAYRQATGLWRGEPLADLPGLHADPARVELAQLREMVILEYADTAAPLHRYEEVLPQLRRCAEANPLQEAVHARLMAALVGAGQRAAALELFEALRRRLAEELGVDPGVEVRDAHQAILRGDLDEPTGASVAPSAPPREAGTPPHPAVPNQLPADVYGFTGRDEDLRHLDALQADVQRQPTAPVVATLMGPPGVGKTTLAVHWAQRVADRFPDGCLYADLGGSSPGGPRARPVDVLAGFLDALDSAPPHPQASLADRAGTFRSLLTGRRILILLDNARDSDQIRPLLPGTSGCMVVVTSRYRLTGLIATEGARSLTIDTMSAAESRSLLRQRLGAPRLATDPAATDAIVAGCGGLPLAVAIVAARAVTNPHAALSALAADLLDQRTVLDTLGGSEAVADMRTVLSWSYCALSTGAAELFRLLGTDPRSDLDAARAAASVRRCDAQLGRDLAELVQANLVRETAAGRLSMHDLLRVYAGELAQTSGSGSPSTYVGRPLTRRGRLRSRRRPGGPTGGGIRRS